MLLAALVAAGCSSSSSTTTKRSTSTDVGASSQGAPGAAAGSSSGVGARIIDVPADPLARDGERHLRHVRQLTSGGENAEGYFAFGGDRLVFQSTRGSLACDAIFTMRLDGSDVRRVSSGRGRTTCAYYLRGDREIFYASTHQLADTCPPRPDYSRGYVWPLYDYDLFVVPADGGAGAALPRPLTDHRGYDAEGTVSPDGERIVWTSLRDGDLDLYSMKIDGSDVRRLTDELGYDGGAFYSPDSKRIVYRASRPTTPEEVARYRELLAENLVEPKTLEIMVADADGKNARAVTSNGAANFAPYWHPDGKRILFASNLGDPKGRNFDIYMIRDDGTGLETVVADSTFDGFPVFSPDGKTLVFASNRASKARGETNLFAAEWIE